MINEGCPNKKPVCVFNPLKKVLKGCRFRSDKNIKSMMMQWFQQQQMDSLLMRSISWCITGMTASMTMDTIFNGLYSFAQNNLQMGFI
jgi:hypothetical protein